MTASATPGLVSGETLAGGHSRWFGRPPLPSLLLIGAWVGALELVGPHHDIVIALLPVLLLVAALVAGRYPGAEALVRLGSRLEAPWRRRRAAPQLGVARRESLQLPRGGSLIGSALAGRAPPSSGSG